MKNKVVIAVLALICVASVIGNVYQYNMLNSSRQQLADARMQLESMTNSYAELDTQLTSLQEELDALNINMADKQSEIDSLAKENSDLQNSISELEASIEETKRIAEEKAMETAKAEQTASASQSSTTTNQNIDTAAQERVLQKAAENGFGITNGTDGMTTVEVANDGAGVTSNFNDVGMWE